MKGVVYVADKGDGTVKIGTSKNPSQRVKELGFAPVNFHCTKYIKDHYKLESTCHSLLGDFSRRGGFI